MYWPQSEWEIRQGVAPRHLPEPSTYTTPDGAEYKYHSYSCTGPYSAPGPARAQVTANQKYGRDESLVVYAEVESSTGVWTAVPKKK